jgi:hypothetical protein
VTAKTRAGKTAADAAAELAAIDAILEPWMWVQSYGQPYYGLPGGMAIGPYRFEGIVKPDLARMTRGAGTTGREARAILTERAEDAFAALEAAGWMLMHGLHMEMSGNVAPFTQTLGGELVEPGEHYDLELKVRFEVNRPR